MTDPIHDFRAKLRQPSLRSQLEAYLAWRRALERARALGEPEPEPPRLAPISINLDLTTACNYRCDHCIDWDVLNSRSRHDEESLRSSLCSLVEHGLRSVILIGGGEPTLYPGFVDFVRFLKDLELDLAVVSNGSRCDKLLEVAPLLGPRDWLRLSLDAGSNELFRTLHRPVKPSLDLESICRQVPRIKARNPRLRVGFSYVVIWKGACRGSLPLQPNVHEIVRATELARRSSFDFIALKPILERASDGAEVMAPARCAQETQAELRRIRRELDRALELATDDFSVHLSTNLRALGDGSWKEHHHQPRTCHMQALRQVLSPTGLFNCPAHRDVRKARIADADAWLDPRAAATALHLLMDRFDASVECREVTCLYNATNWWLEKMVQDPRQELEPGVGEERLDFFL